MAPKYVKKIICLANSRKDSGRCVAGKELAGDKLGGWIRPVSERPTGEVSEEERRFENGQDPKPLDIIAIPMIQARPHNFQSENHLIDDQYYWAKEGQATWDQIRAAIDRIPGPLWDNSSPDTHNGVNDRVEEGLANTLDSS